MNILVTVVKLFRKLQSSPKIFYKRILFQRNSLLGKNVSLSKDANIVSPSINQITIGNNCDLLCHLIVRDQGLLTIGENTTIRSNSYIGCVKRITIGNNVIISNNVHIYDNNNHPTDPLKRLEMTRSGFYSSLWEWSLSDIAPINIEDNVWIGERSTILKGVTVGQGSIVGCDSVVTKDIPPFCIAAGNPAKVVKHLEH